MDIREFPSQFSAPLRRILKAISIGQPNVVGSSADHRVQYYADYDLIETIQATAGSIKAFTRLIQKCERVGKITDIKCGEVSEWNLMTKVKVSANKVHNYDQAKELKHLRELWQNEIITHEEFMEAERELKPELTTVEALNLKKDLRFGVVRWTPKEVIQGHKQLRDESTFYLEEAVKSNGLTKVDLIAWVKDKYVEFSNIIIWTRRNGKPYLHATPLKESLKESVLQFHAEGNFIKVAKRMLSLSKLYHDTETTDKIITILNSYIGALYLVVADIQVLEEFPDQTKPKRRKELDFMRDRFAKLYFPKYNSATPSTKLIPELEQTLQDETRKELTEAKLLPIPSKYRI